MIISSARQLAERGESSALAGELQMKTGDIEISMPLGPEARGDAPFPYDVDTASRDSSRESVWRATAARVLAASDVDGARGCRFANAVVGVTGVEIELNSLLRLRASQISVCTLVSLGFESLCAAVDVTLRSATIETEGVGPIPLNGTYAPNTVLLPELLEPLGLHLVVNEQIVPRVGADSHGLQVTALRMRFDGARFGSSAEAYGELGLGITHASLSLAPLRSPLGAGSTDARSDDSHPLIPPVRAASDLRAVGRPRRTGAWRQQRSNDRLCVA